MISAYSTCSRGTSSVKSGRKRAGEKTTTLRIACSAQYRAISACFAASSRPSRITPSPRGRRRRSPASSSRPPPSPEHGLPRLDEHVRITSELAAEVRPRQPVLRTRDHLGVVAEAPELHRDPEGFAPPASGDVIADRRTDVGSL